MNLLNRKYILLLVVVGAFHFSFGQSSNKIKVLIVDGFSNHNWKQTSFVVKSILEKSDLFEVTISSSPSEENTVGWEQWNPSFKKYDVVIQNTNNIQNPELKWSSKMQRSLDKYVKKGGGLYILHSANNAFSDWKAYNTMIGLGWRTKDEGVAIQITSDKKLLVIPKGEGENTYHGPRNDAEIKVLNAHPINNGFPSSWKTPNIELYKFARGEAENLTVLSYATDEKTGINWPVDWIVNYGLGHVYNGTFGHLWKDETYPNSYKCIGFQTTLIRSMEWLATQKVTYKVPDDFPTATKISLDTSEIIN